MSWLIQIEQYKNISIAKSHYRKLVKKKETNTLTLQFYNKRLLDNKHFNKHAFSIQHQFFDKVKLSVQLRNTVCI